MAQRSDDLKQVLHSGSAFRILWRSATVARSLGVSDAIVGLTIVAIGTSAPEFVTTLRGDRDIALGNLLGSSVYNLALILGLTILFAAIVVEVPAEVLEGDLVLMAAAGHGLRSGIPLRPPHQPDRGRLVRRRVRCLPRVVRA